MYVCTSQVAKRVYLYVSGNKAFALVCLKQQSVYLCMSQIAKRVCWHVSDSSACMFACLR